eukprot:11168255-Lingulodinium_polyedra.AAC.1
MHRGTGRPAEKRAHARARAGTHGVLRNNARRGCADATARADLQTREHGQRTRARCRMATRRPARPRA